MANSFARLDQVLADLIETYADVESKTVDKFSDESSFSHAMVEGLETALESALDETGANPKTVANMLGALSEALESLDPSAFDEDGADSIDFDLSESQVDYEEEDIDLDEDDEDVEEDEEEELYEDDDD